ncbi:hypothetical protein M422DRAFT_38558 [Sphaerobolus stellatus SS14]|uniref:Unplaced genomic scaffold SPHSTscaffold_329, whole genome shotgun sequence n=1 Tax=Sphaerobolus stellatus (strain SS14) TaxID=990650 RepID=A0A0C9UJS3_SPHS4|nr:hypothetical protein M422DRAFT_38558 [Sphaerobolus stellatus SS14]
MQSSLYSTYSPSRTVRPITSKAAPYPTRFKAFKAVIMLNMDDLGGTIEDEPNHVWLTDECPIYANKHTISICCTSNSPISPHAFRRIHS